MIIDLKGLRVNLANRCSAIFSSYFLGSSSQFSGYRGYQQALTRFFIHSLQSETHTLSLTAGHFNDLRSFRQQNYEWTDLTGLVFGFKPTPRTKHGVASTGTSIYVFGGSSNEGKEKKKLL